MDPLTRRRFLQIAGAAPLALTHTPAVQAAPTLAFAPAAFDAGPDSALIWVCGNDAGRVRVELSSDPAFTSVIAGPTVPLTDASDFSAAIPVTQLTSNTSWSYRIVDAATGKPISQVGRFRTAPATPAPFSFAFSADMEEKYQPFTIYDAIAAKRPDFFLFLGDSIYADHPTRQFAGTLSHYRGKHAANRKDRHLQAFLAQHATCSIWDDHETFDNANSTHPNMDVGLRAYKEYWPCRTADAARLYRRFAWAGVDFIMLDARRFRSPQSMEDGAAKTMLGGAQKAWFKEQLKSSSAPFKFVVTSVPFQGGGADSWGGYKTEQQEIVRFMRDEKIRGVIFLTGDYHLARDWSNAKTGLREFMAGPVASFTHYQKRPEARERYEKAGTFHYGDGFNFGLVNVDPAAGKVTVQFIGLDGATLGEVNVT